MREFDKPIGRVWRRLRFQRFLGSLVWCWGVSLLATAGVIAVEKFARWPVPGTRSASRRWTAPSAARRRRAPRNRISRYLMVVHCRDSRATRKNEMLCS